MTYFNKLIHTHTHTYWILRILTHRYCHCILRKIFNKWKYITSNCWCLFVALIFFYSTQEQNLWSWRKKLRHTTYKRTMEQSLTSTSVSTSVALRMFAVLHANMAGNNCRGELRAKTIVKLFITLENSRCII